MENYLNQLPLTVEERDKLRTLAAKSPAALLSLIRASYGSFSRYFGAERTRQLITWLTPLLTEEERQRALEPAKAYPIQQAQFTDSPAPVVPRPDFDVEERDRLFDRLRRLQMERDPSAEVQREIAALEQQLHAMLR